MDFDREFNKKKNFFPNSTHRLVKRLEKHRFELKLAFASGKCEFWHQLLNAHTLMHDWIRRQLFNLFCRVVTIGNQPETLILFLLLKYCVSLILVGT